jgi:hypothetical protein
LCKQSSIVNCGGKCQAKLQWETHSAVSDTNTPKT